MLAWRMMQRCAFTPDTGYAEVARDGILATLQGIRPRVLMRKHFAE